MTRLPSNRPSKYGAKKQTINGIEFDSKAEAEYYMVLLSKEQAGEIESFRLQPKFILQDEFTKNGHKYQAITYTADFEVTHKDGTVEIIDIKGFANDRFDLKKKMFEYRYPDLTLTVLKLVKRYGGFITTEEYTRLKRKEKKDGDNQKLPTGNRNTRGRRQL